MLGVMRVPSRSAERRTVAPPARRTLFVVSRDQPRRYDSLAHAFDGDYGVRVIFDRRRGDRRQRPETPTLERRQEGRRSEARDGVLRSVGWVRTDGAA
jgi:hypothetical protein